MHLTNTLIVVELFEHALISTFFTTRISSITFLLFDLSVEEVDFDGLPYQIADK